MKNGSARCGPWQKPLLPDKIDWKEDSTDESLHGADQRGAQGGLDEAFEPGGDGYNIGANAGTAAGQGIFNAHIEVIPRYQGDVGNTQRGRVSSDSRQGTLHALNSIILSV